MSDDSYSSIRYPFNLRHATLPEVTVSSISALRTHARRTTGLSAGYLAMTEDREMLDMLRARGWLRVSR